MLYYRSFLICTNKEFMIYDMLFFLIICPFWENFDFIEINSGKNFHADKIFFSLSISVRSKVIVFLCKICQSKACYL